MNTSQTINLLCLSNLAFVLFVIQIVLISLVLRGLGNFNIQKLAFNGIKAVAETQENIQLYKFLFVIEGKCVKNRITKLESHHF